MLKAHCALTGGSGLTNDFEYQAAIEEPTAQPTSPQERSGYHGRRARMADGTIAVWQESPSGRGGRFVSLGEGTASTQAREALANERARLGTLTRTAPMAEEFITINRATPTGSWGARSFERERRAQTESDGDLWNGLNMPLQFEPNRQGLERMADLQDQALRGNIPQGGAQTANSGFEQQVLRGLFPSYTSLGNTNLQNAATLLAERDLQEQRLAAMERWITQNQDFSGFEESWAQRAGTARPQLIDQYRRRLRDPNLLPSGQVQDPSTGAATGAMVGAFGARQPARQAGTGDAPVEFMRDSQTGRIVPARR